MHVFGGIALAAVLLLFAIVISGCGMQKLEDFPATRGEWKTQVEKAREAQNPTPPGGE